MQRPPIEKLRRLALGVALALLIVSAASYAVRAWRARRARQSVPVVASDVEQQAQGFTFSRSEAGRTLFTIAASRTIERQGRKTQLEGVSVVVYGREGNRADEIRTGRCAYEAAGGEKISCPDPVRFDLSAAGGPGEMTHRLHIETSGVRFDQATGVAETSEAVTFEFAEGRGRGVGLRYQPGQPRVVLERGVEIVLLRDAQPQVTLRGQRLELDTQQRLFRLRPPLAVVAGDRELVAGELTIGLDTSYRLERLEAMGAVKAWARPVGRSWNLGAQQVTAEFMPGRGLQRLSVSGGVEFEAVGTSQEALTCQSAEVFFHAQNEAPHRVVAIGDAHLRSALTGENRELAAERMEMWLQPQGGGVERVAAQSRGVLAISQARGMRRQIEADRLELEFHPRSRLAALAAHGSVEAVWQRPGRPPQRTTSAELKAEFSPDGTLRRAEQWGGIQFHEGDREAAAGQAVFEAAREVFLLTGQVSLTERTLQLTAGRIEISQRDARVAASRDVRTSYTGSAANRLFGSALPVHVVADEMQGERSEPGRAGWARYAGRARLWQGENRLEAERVELFESPRELVASGQVASVLVERRAGAAARVVRVASEHFRYLEAERRGVYEGKAQAEGVFGRLRASRVELQLSDGARGEVGVERAQARGGVTVEQGTLRAEAENADYSVESGSVVLWGGEPQLSDPRYGSSRGARLTFNLADDTILIESGTGSRTVVRRTWAR